MAAREEHFRGIGWGRAQQGVRDGLEPRNVVRRAREWRITGRGWLVEAGGEGAMTTTFERIEASVRGDAMKPRAKRRPLFVEPLEGLPRADPGLLEDVLRVRDRAHHSIANREDLAAIGRGLLLEVVVRRHALRSHRKIDGSSDESEPSRRYVHRTEKSKWKMY